MPKELALTHNPRPSQGLAKASYYTNSQKALVQNGVSFDSK